MLIAEIIKTAIKQRGMTQTILAEKTNYRSQSGVAQILGNKNPGICTIAQLLNAMDYDIVIRSRLTDKTEYKVEVEKKDV